MIKEGIKLVETLPERKKTVDIKIYDPSELRLKTTPRKIASVFTNLLDTVYGGMSDTPDGHPPDKFEEMITAGEMMPFIVYEGERPVGCCAWRWYGPKMDFGSACLLPSHRRSATKIRGADLYAAADFWLKENMRGRYAYSIGGFRLPESTAIAVNKSNWFPSWIAPLASWGYPSEPLSESGRKQEFLVLGERYIDNSVYVPKIIYIPNNVRAGNIIQNAWHSLAEYSGRVNRSITKIANATSASPILFDVDSGDEESIWLDCNPDNHINGLTLNKILAAAFGGTLSGYPKTRLVFTGVPANIPEATLIQDRLLENGFVFSGIVPGIKDVKYVDRENSVKTYRREPLNVYVKLRSDVQPGLNKPPQMRFNNLLYQKSFDSIIRNWFKD